MDIAQLHQSIVDGDVEEVKKFTIDYPAENHAYSNGKSAAFAAFESKEFDIYKILITSGFSVGQHEKIYVIKHFAISIKKLHESIRSNQTTITDEIECFLKKYPFENFAYNVNSESAVAVALTSRKFDFYDILISNGFRLGPKEDLKKILAHLDALQGDGTFSGPSMKRRKLIGDSNVKWAKYLSLKHVAILKSRSRISHDNPDSELRKCYSMIEKAFCELSEIAWIEPILKIVANANDLKIIFDFNRDSVDHVHPTVGTNVSGIIYPKSAQITIGALGLKSPETDSSYCKVLGTLVHELCHCAMNLVYKNNCKPYQLNDVNSQNEFNQILQSCEINKALEPYIEYVYDYHADYHHAELIVRVPHLFALYKNDVKKRRELMGIFEKLFKFYEQKTLKDLKDKFPLMEAENELNELNEFCGVLQVLQRSAFIFKPVALNLNINSTGKALNISSNCSELTIRAIQQKLSSEENFASSYVFTKIENFTNAKMFELILNAFKLSTSPTIIVDCDDLKQLNLSEVAAKLPSSGMTQRIIFVSNETLNLGTFGFDHTPMTHAWNDLTTEFQDELLTREIILQGKKIKLGNIFDNESLDEITEIPLKKLMANEEIKIGIEMKFKGLEYYVERKLLPPNAQIIVFGDETDDSDSDDSNESTEADDYNIDHSVDNVLSFIDDHQTILLFDEPGMGKSTELKMMAKRLQDKFPTHWILFIDLKEFCQVYEKDAKISTNFDKHEKIAEFISEKVLKVESFEAKVFMHLFKDDRVIILMDGFDEICPSFGKFVISLMIGIKIHSSNRLWMSTRPHLTKELENAMHPKTFKLKPFTEKNRKEFFEKFFTAREINKEIVAQRLIEIGIFLNSLIEPWKQSNVCNPLLLRMIIEIFEDDPEFDLSRANPFSIFDKFTNKMIEKCMDKGPEAKKLFVNSFGNSSIIEYYQLKAFETITHHRAKFDEMLNLSFINVSTPSFDDIIRVGLMYFDGENFQFLLRTFAEFFVVKFFYEMIFRQKFRSPEELEAIMEVFVEVCKDDDGFYFVLSLIDNAIDFYETERCGKRLDIVKVVASTILKKDKNRNIFFVISKYDMGKLKKFCSLIAKVLDTESIIFFFHETNSQVQNIFRVTSAYEFRYEVFKFFVDYFLCLFEDKEEANEELKKLLLIKDSEGINSIGHDPMIDRDPETNGNIFDFLSHKMNRKCFKELLMGCSHNIIHHGVYFKDIKIFLDILKENFTESNQIKKLLELEYRGRFTLIKAAEICKEKNFQIFWDFLCSNLDSCSKEEILMHQNEDNETVLHTAINNKNEETFDFVLDLYEQNVSKEKIIEIVMRDARNKNFFVYALWYDRKGSKRFERLCTLVKKIFADDDRKQEKLKENFMTLNRNGQRSLTNAASCLGKEKFELFRSFFCDIFEDCETREQLLMQRNVEGKSVFDYAMRNIDDEIFNFVSKIYLEILGEETFKKFLTETVQDIFIFFPYADKSFKLFWNFMLSLFQSEKFKLKKNLLQRNVEGKTFYEEIEGRSNFDKIREELSHFIEEYFSKEEKKQIKFKRESTNTL